MLSCHGLFSPTSCPITTMLIDDTECIYWKLLNNSLLLSLNILLILIFCNNQNSNEWQKFSNFQTHTNFKMTWNERMNTIWRRHNKNSRKGLKIRFNCRGSARYLSSKIFREMSLTMVSRRIRPISQLKKKVRACFLRRRAGDSRKC